VKPKSNSLADFSFYRSVQCLRTTPCKGRIVPTDSTSEKYIRDDNIFCDWKIQSEICIGIFGRRSDSGEVFDSYC